MKRISLVCLLTASGFGCGGGGNSVPTDAGSHDVPTTQDSNTNPDVSQDTSTSQDGNNQDGQQGQDMAADATPAAPTCVPPADKDNPVQKLSDTGCMDPNNPTEFAPGVFSYEVNSPLWSDGADKKRGFFLPAGGKVHVLDCANEPKKCLVGPQDTGKWQFPVGTVMVKTFMFDSKLVETRLFVHFDDTTWVGYGYKWNEAQTEATVVANDGDDVNFDTGSRSVAWHYPSRDDCMTCHFSTAGFTLGPEMKQMNRMVGGQNQIDSLAANNVFDQKPSQPYQAPLATPYSGSWGPATTTASAEDRARSYIHANCSFCHRPDSNFPDIDLRYGVALENMNICGLTPERGTADVDGALLLTPGAPEMSTMWLRMQSLQDKVRMPNIATFMVDQDALGVVGDWIKSIQSCPGQ